MQCSATGPSKFSRRHRTASVGCREVCRTLAADQHRSTRIGARSGRAFAGSFAAPMNPGCHSLARPFVAMTLRLPDPLYGTLAVIVAVLVAATVGPSVANRVRLRLRPAEVLVHIRMWWYIVTGFLIALFVSRTLAVVGLGLVSFVAFKEFLTLARTRRADNKVLLWAYLTIPFQYFWVGTGWYGMFIVFIPVYVFLLLRMRMVLLGETEGFLRSVGVIHWGLMTTVFCVSHLASLLML